MQLVNWQGALIGPGSEWFWAAAQFVVVVVSLFGIYRQLRSQGAANAVQRIETLEGEWTSPKMTHARLVLALHLKYESQDLAGFFKARPILDFFVNLGNLHDWGFLSLDEIDSTWGQAIPVWTALIGSLVDVARANDGRANIYDLDSLIARLRGLQRKKGMEPPPLDEATLARMLDWAIAANTASLEQEAAWQSGKIPAAPRMEQAT
jgi:hypothetical protein